MQGGGAGQAQPDCEQPTVHLVCAGLDRPPHRGDHVVEIIRVGHVDHALGPACDVAVDRPQFGDAPVFHHHFIGALGPGLADRAALEIAGKHHVRMLSQHFGAVHMAERPVVVALGGELVERAGRIVRVPVAAAKRGMQQADVEQAAGRLGIAGHQIIGDVAPRIAHAVQGHVQPVDCPGFGGLVREHLYVVRQRQAARHLVLGVVVAVDQIDRNRCRSQTVHLAHEEHARLVIAPVAVVQIARDDDEIHRALNGRIHECGECFAGRQPQPFGDARHVL